MYSDLRRSSISYNITLWHDYMPDVCSGERRLWLLIFCKYFYAILYMYLFVYSFRRGTVWRGLSVWRRAFHREKHRSTRCGYRFLNECVKRLHRNHASWAKFKRAWSVLEWVTASSRAKCPICSLSSTPGHPMKFRLTNSVINNNGSSHLYCQFHFVNNAIFLFNVTFTLIGCLCRK